MAREGIGTAESSDVVFVHYFSGSGLQAEIEALRRSRVANRVIMLCEDARAVSELRREYGVLVCSPVPPMRIPRIVLVLATALSLAWIATGSHIWAIGALAVFLLASTWSDISPTRNALTIARAIDSLGVKRRASGLIVLTGLGVGAWCFFAVFVIISARG